MNDELKSLGSGDAHLVKYLKEDFYEIELANDPKFPNLSIGAYIDEISYKEKIQEMIDNNCLFLTFSNIEGNAQSILDMSMISLEKVIGRVIDINYDANTLTFKAFNDHLVELLLDIAQHEDVYAGALFVSNINSPLRRTKDSINVFHAERAICYQISLHCKLKG